MKLTIDSLLRLDDTGMIEPADLRQLLNRDIRELFQRDKDPNKSGYIADCIVIYMCGDPKSPARQQGLSEDECIKYAIQQTGIKKDYKKDILVRKLIKQYNEENLTESGKVVDNLLKAIHNQNKVIDKYLEFLNGALESAATIEQTSQVVNLMSDLNKIAKDLPTLVNALNTAKNNLMYDIQEEQSRGGGKVLSSMNAEDYMDD